MKKFVVLTLISLTISGCGIADNMAKRMIYPFAAVNKAFPGNEESLAKIGDLENETIVFFCHGNFQNIRSLRAFSFIDWLSQRALVVMPEYPGIDPVAGEISEAGIMAKVRADFDALKKEYPDRRIIVMGWSLGAAVASQLSKDEVEELVLVSPWTSAKNAANDHKLGFIAGLISDNFWNKHGWESLETLKGFEGKIAIIHGESDSLIPVGHGRAIAGESGVDPVIVPSGHNDVLVNADALRTIGEILDQ